MTGEGDERQTRGRPRERAILSAVIDLLGEAGYDAMTLDAVASRAHASKTTIYRRWPGKPELVRAAVDAFIAGRVLSSPDTGHLRGDLLAVMRALRGHLTAEFIAMMSGLVHAMKADSELARSLRSLFDQDSVSEEIINRAVSRGELPPHPARKLAQLVHEVIEAQLFRRMMAGDELDDVFAHHVVDDIVLPLLSGSVAPSRAHPEPTPSPRDEMTGAAAVPLTTFDSQELERFTRAFEELFDAADPASMTSYYAENAQLMAEDMEPIQGRDAIEQFWRAAISRAAAARARRAIKLHESSFSGDLGYALCTVTIEIPPGVDPAGPGGVSIAVWDAAIWQRSPDGEWRIAVDISTPLPPR